MNEDLKNLGDEFYEYKLEVSPTTALMQGDHRYDALIEDATREAEDEQIGRLRAFAYRADMIDPYMLDDQERITREVLAALDPKSGKTRWEHRYDAPVETGPSLSTQYGEGPNGTPLLVDGRMTLLDLDKGRHIAEAHEAEPGSDNEAR